MKKIFFLVYIFITVSLCYTQTPYYSVKFTITESHDKNSAYTISERRCSFKYKPVIPSGDYWFGKDTSRLNWNNLPDSMYNLLECRDMETVYGKQFIDGTQSMIWENIFIITVTRQKPGIAADTMTIVFPVLIKSFVTFIDLGNVVFTPGYFELTDNLIYNTNDNVSAALPENFTWESIGFENRKIKINNK
jgi:hypothetical protein